MTEEVDARGQTDVCPVSPGLPSDGLAYALLEIWIETGGSGGCHREAGGYPVRHSTGTVDKVEAAEPQSGNRGG